MKRITSNSIQFYLVWSDLILLPQCLFSMSLNLSLYGHSVQIMDGKGSTQLKGTWKKMGDEERKAAVNDELKRMNQLPVNSSYVIHRLRVLNKILQLISLQRTASQEEELELLFSGLSI
ncbi:hypothetical protein Dsin_016400 [Dipteronia sinensis]|uniref:Uncharacterized protein n=1 Tax=Dipteronia sinensis TaxID=43782 RepID=A0AAE0ADA9_9ROSI|nr:hypothetical protein Dsin_016400 [Dipteronia sinensis]